MARSKPKKKAKPSRRRASARGRSASLLMAAIALVGIAALIVYAGRLAWSISGEFEGRRWDLPAQVYAAPLELYAGRAITQDELVGELRRLGYSEDPRLPGPGTYRVALGRVDLATRGFSFGSDVEPEKLVSISFSDGRISALRNARGGITDIVRLNPLLIGSLFPVHGEDRLIVGPDEIPPLLTDALIAVEDRRFDSHFGIDLIAMLRAALVNLKAGQIRQGASTLTQQLVRSYFLDNQRTWWRKLREALMAIALELRYEKDELLHAYVNEIYLGQDGGRAIHGFGLASQFYFGKPLSELDLHEIALLVAEVRGPTYYDPRRHPERALERRKLVLEMMAASALVSPEEAAAAAQRDLGLIDSSRRSAAQSAFLRLVRRQLSAEFATEDLERTGLTVMSTLDPAVQAAAERALAEGIEALGKNATTLDGAVVVTSPHTGEVRALVGGKRTSFDGFNRALDARRQVGSLIKPAVYLAALESRGYSLASIIDDAPIEVRLENGDRWLPANFDKLAHGMVPLVRALAESLNMATVRLGLDVGLPAVADTLERLGAPRLRTVYPSMLLGAVTLTPIEVAQIYNTLANGGFRVPLRAVRSVIREDGTELQRYPLKIEQVAEPADVYAVNQALIQVMERGTGRTVRAALPGDATVAGKTGTSDDLRDSWFAGFTNDHLVVAWLGADDNSPTGLTGSTGAGRIWSRVMSGLEPSSYFAPAPPEMETVWIDYLTGIPSAAHCPNAIAVPIPADTDFEQTLDCDGRTAPAGRFRSWFRKQRQ